MIAGGPYQYRLRKAGTGTGEPQDSVIVFTCDDLGYQVVEVWTGDPNGNWDYTETFVDVQELFAGICDDSSPTEQGGCWPDKTPPELLVYGGFAQGLVWESAGPAARFYAADFIRLGRDKCHNNLGWRITKTEQNPGIKPPKAATSSLVFSCNELGNQPVWIWLRDGAGNWTKTETYVLVEDNTGACGPGHGLAQAETPERNRGIIAPPGSMPVPAKSRAEQPGVSAVSLSVWPNPVSDIFAINARLPLAGMINLSLYDNLGRLVRSLADQQWAEAGDFQAAFSRDNLPSGLYRCVLQSRDGMQSVAVVLR